MDVQDNKRLQEILNADLSVLSKREINQMREELKKFISWWEITPIWELKILGKFKTIVAMHDKKDAMLKALKK